MIAWIESRWSRIKTYVSQPLSDAWHWVFYGVVLSCTPLLLTISFECVTGTNIDTLRSKFFSDILLATFALAGCVCGEATSGKTFKLSRDVSILTMICCTAFYFAVYVFEDMQQKMNARYGEAEMEVSDFLSSIGDKSADFIFLIFLGMFALNFILGLGIALLRSKRTDQDDSTISH